MKSLTASITLRRPDDWHVHFRDGAMMRSVLPWTARQFGRAVVMPNLVPPVTDIAAARAARGFAEGVFAAVKLYPAHATTHSAHGITDVGRVMPVLERMAAIGMP